METDSCTESATLIQFASLMGQEQSCSLRIAWSFQEALLMPQSLNAVCQRKGEPRRESRVGLEQLLRSGGAGPQELCFCPFKLGDSIIFWKGAIPVEQALPFF